MKLLSHKLEDLSVGMSERIHRTISLADIEAFSELTRDRHPLHTDAAYAENSGFKGILAHGMLLSSLSSALVGMRLPGRRAIVMSQQFKFLSPAYPGDDLTLVATISEIDNRFSVIHVDVHITHGEEKIAEGNYVVKLR